MRRARPSCVAGGPCRPLSRHKGVCAATPSAGATSGLYLHYGRKVSGDCPPSCVSSRSDDALPQIGARAATAARGGGRRHKPAASGPETAPRARRRPSAPTLMGIGRQEDV